MINWNRLPVASAIVIQLSLVNLAQLIILNPISPLHSLLLMG
jgi:hypothetical protein